MTMLVTLMSREDSCTVKTRPAQELLLQQLLDGNDEIKHAIFSKMLAR